MTVDTEWIEIDVPGEGPLRAYLSRPAQVGRQTPTPAVVVAHELFGVNADIRQVTETLAEHGFLAVAPQFYHRTAGADVEFPRDDEGRRTGFEHLHRLEREQARADVRAVLDHLAERPDTTSAIGMLGFSAGGHLAFLAATTEPIPATAVLYGGWLPTTGIPLSRPEPTLDRAGDLAGELLYLVGGQDAVISDTEVDQIRDALAQAGPQHRVVVYPQAEHAYFWPGTSAHDAGATADSWRLVLELFDRTLRGR